MNIHNIFNKAQLTVPFTIKRQEYQQFRFTDNTNPIVLAYQALHWWFPTSLSQNRSNYDGLAGISWGMQVHKGEIEIEVYGVTRERLLEGGSTNYKTYDFETSQNLFLTTFDRAPEQYKYDYKAISQGRMPFDQPRWTGTPFDSLQDYYTREEIPQRAKKSIDVNFERLHHNNIWRVQKSNELYTQAKDGTSTISALYLIPGPQEMPPIDPAGTQTIVNNRELLLSASEAGITHDTMWNRATYPMKVLNPPLIEDETGTMKWIYECRVSTKLHVTFFLKPDYQDNLVDDYLLRQVYQLPMIKAQMPATSTTVTIPCAAYEVKC